MNEYRYILQPYTGRNSRYMCPLCRKPHEFSRYIDTETGEMLADEVGKCNRIDRCGYHYTPKQYFADNVIKPESAGVITPRPQPPVRPVSYIDKKIFNQSLKGYDHNNLIKYLQSIFDTTTVELLINLYKIGTSSRYGGGTTVYWEIDSNDRVRAGKLIKYAENGHRVHGKNNWVHSVLKLDNFNLKQCLFGEHILKHAPDATVCIVESEKTAIIASAFLPEMVWLATGGAENLNKEKMKVLRGRKVMLFPDASKDGSIFLKWEQKSNEFRFNISDLLEKEATSEQKAEGVDIADFLIKQDWRLFRKQPVNLPVTNEVYEKREKCEPLKTKLFSHVEPQCKVEVSNKNSFCTNGTEAKNPRDKVAVSNTGLKTDWSNEIEEMESYFSGIELPGEPIKLNAWSTIIDTKRFVECNLSFVKANNGNKTFLPYLNQLQAFKMICSSKAVNNTSIETMKNLKQ